MSAFPTGGYWVCSGPAYLVPSTESPPLAACSTLNVMDLGTALTALGVVSTADLQAVAGNGSTTNIVVSSPEAPINYQTLGELWGFGFTTVLIFWLISHVAGAVISPLRSRD